VSSSLPPIENLLLLLATERGAVRVRLGQQSRRGHRPKLESRGKSRLNSIRYLLCGVADTRGGTRLLDCEDQPSRSPTGSRFTNAGPTRRVKLASVSNLLRLQRTGTPSRRSRSPCCFACLRSRARLRLREGFRDPLPPNGSRRENPGAVSLVNCPPYRGARPSIQYGPSTR